MGIWKFVGASLMALAMAGCAPSLSGANQAGGIIEHSTAGNRDQAFAIANDHCKQFGRIARISGTDVLDSTMTFDCVRP